MAVYDLVGAGIQGLSSGTTHLFVEVIVYGAGISTGMAIPTNYYGLGLLRLGWHGGFRQVIPIDASMMFVTVPDPTDQLGYFLFTSTAIRVTESF